MNFAFYENQKNRQSIEIIAFLLVEINVSKAKSHNIYLKK